MKGKKHNDEQEEIIDIDTTEGGEDGESGDIQKALAKIAKLKTELAQAKKESHEYLDGWQRLRAEVANNKKSDAVRMAREKSLAAAGIVEELLPILDGYDMARGGKDWDSLDATWRAGIEQIFTQLEQVLIRAGAERTGRVGEQFDPNKHEAVSSSKAASAEQDNTITQVLRSGWQLGDKTIRPAQVIVAHHQ